MTVVEWLLDSDPSIRWQVMRDLTDEPDDVVAAERSRVASEGWGARLLDRQAPDGRWGDATYSTWIETPGGSATCALLLLRDLGLDPTSEEARRAVTLVRDNITHDEGGKPFFAQSSGPFPSISASLSTALCLRQALARRRQRGGRAPPD